MSAGTMTTPKVQSLDALVAQAADAVREAEVFLEEAKVLAPFDGVVAEKLAEPGDLATPGRPILLLQDPRRLRLEVQVPESCAKDARLGMDVRVRIDALSKEVEGKIDEVLPAADPRSRTFLVKASLPDAPDLRPGMFGRLLQDCGKKTMLLVPRAAVTAVGQIETVRVRGDDGVFGPRHVRTGKTIGDRLEVLSGLAEGDVVRLAGGP